MLARIQGVVDREPGLSRVQLSRRVCEWLNWRSVDGRLKEMSSRVALLRLHRRGVLCLPRVVSGGRVQPRRVMTERLCGDPEPVVSMALADVLPVDVVRIDRADSRMGRVWNDLMGRYHPLGAGPLCGAQMRYLLWSSRWGWLGGLAFSSAAWRVAARDRWMGWTDAVRQRHLSCVVNNSRFLVVPHLRVPHLASHVLGLVLRRLPEDWRVRYGETPLLVETFVEADRFRGTCYRAANWIEVGQTQGRGRQDRFHRGGRSPKRVFLYPLRSLEALRVRWSSQACERDDGPDPKPVAEDWAEAEFGRADFGDHRLRERLLTLARDFAARPQASIPQACQSRAKTKAAYRFFDHSETTMEQVLSPHYAMTIQRMRHESLVLAVQDTTTLNYSAHPATEGMGPMSSRREGAVGLLLHDTLALTSQGTPLGLLDVQCWARDGRTFGKKHTRGVRPIADKESRKWLDSFNRVATVQQQCPETRVVSVGDREADLYELFHKASEASSGMGLLVRAEHDRLVEQGQGHLWETLSLRPVAGMAHVHIPRRGSVPAREADLAIHYGNVTLKPPSGKGVLGPVSLYAVRAIEPAPPEGATALEWMLLTTVSVDSLEAAVERIRWYGLRWQIEVYHRTLKSGCRIEERQLGSADRIEACLAIDMVVAWRIFHLAKLGREVPDVPCTVFFEDAEWKALVTYMTRTPVPPPQPPTLREAIRMTATLGGFLGRRSDGEPGTQSLWIGLQHLDAIAAMWSFMVDHFAPHLRPPPVSSNPTYG